MIADLIRRGYERNVRIVQAQADGLIHEQSLTQTEYNINCFNWVVGHIVASRSGLLTSFGAEPIMSEEQVAVYERESNPITEDGPGVIPFETLLEMLDATQDAIDEMLGSATDAWMAEETQITPDRASPRVSQFMFIYFHDTYHTGQTDLLRQMSGVSDKVI